MSEKLSLPPLKSKIQYILQQLLGFDRYLRLFAQFKVATIKHDSKENDFFTFLSLLPSGGIALDVGANLGIMTHFLSQLSDTKVIAIEPMPQNFKVLQFMQNKFDWANVILSQVAVGERDGEVEMVMPEVDAVQKQGLSHVVHETITEFNEGKKLHVPMTTLDGLVTNENRHVVGIKIDVENYEYFALLGAKKILSEQKPIVYTELWENENRTKVMDLLDSLGYGCYVVLDGKTVRYQTEVHTTQNFIFIPETA